jgi:hypothetical protein
MYLLRLHMKTAREPQREAAAQLYASVSMARAVP